MESDSEATGNLHHCASSTISPNLPHFQGSRIITFILKKKKLVWKTPQQIS